ncbi:MAG: hypothetical protein V3S01_05610 [Dehalococcoidia bacterium]
MSNGRVGRTDHQGVGYCGPTAVTVIAGQPLERVEAAFRMEWGSIWRKNGKLRPITGTNSGSVTSALEFFGVRRAHWHDFTDICEPVKETCPTLARWIKERTPEERSMWAIVVVGTSRGTHWVVVKGRKWWDHSSETGGSFTSTCPYRRGRAREVVFYHADPAREVKARWRERVREWVALCEATIGTRERKIRRLEDEARRLEDGMGELRQRVRKRKAYARKAMGVR